MTDRICREEGRRLFGDDPEAYGRTRPPYPDWIFAALAATGALFDGAITLEIGPGSGLATRQLLARGANPLTLVEPDERFATMLARLVRETHARCSILHGSFEEVDLPARSFDLIAAATVFHWLDPATAFHRARGLLKPGGTLALMWNVLQDLDKPDPFHDATATLLAPLAISPSGAPGSLPFALDRAARERDARAAGFATVAYQESRWSITLSADQVVELYAGFSSIQRLAERERKAVLDELGAIAVTRFGSRVVRNVTSCLYQIY